MGGVESLIGSIFCFFLWWSLQVKLHSCTNDVFFSSSHFEITQIISFSLFEMGNSFKKCFLCKTGIRVRVRQFWSAFSFFRV